MKNEIEFKQTMALDTVNELLKDLVKSLEEGTICFERGDEFVTLKPVDVINVEIEAETKKANQKFSIELSWRQPKPGKEDLTAIKISSQKPEMVAPTPDEVGFDTEDSTAESDQ